MKTQLFFTALLMAVAGMGTQDVYAEDENVTLPSKLAYYDFEDEDYTVFTAREHRSGGDGQGNATPDIVKMLDNHVLRFSCGTGGNANNTYVRMANPFKDKDMSSGATVSVWVRRESSFGGSNDAVWSFDGNSSFSLWANKFVIGGSNHSNVLAEDAMYMLTVCIDGNGNYTLYNNGVSIGTGNSSDILSQIQSAGNFCLGEITNMGTFTGVVDDLTFYTQGLTDEEVKQLYKEQNKNWTEFSAAAKEMTEGQTLGFTYLLTNASCAEYNSDGWSGGAVRGVFEYAHWNSDGIYNGTFVESNTNNNPQKGVDVLYQELSGLPDGMYRATAYVGGRNAVALPENCACAEGFEFFANEGSTAITQTRFEYVSVDCAVTGGKLRLGIHATDANTNVWCGLADVRLEYLGSSVEFSEEDETTAPVVAFYNVVKVKRAMRQDVWNTFCVPFPMTSEQLSANGIKEVRVLDEATVGTDHATLKFTQVDAIEPGKPYIVKVSVPVSEIKVSGVALQSSMNDIYSNGVTMKGNYAKGVVPDGAFFINNNAFYLADTENSVQKVTLKGFRAYIESSVTGELNRMQIDIDGVVTSVEDVLGGAVPDGYRTVDVYSLSGVKVKSGVKQCEALDGLKKGIYVVEGKKVIK